MGITEIAAIPIVAGLVEVVKRTNVVAQKWIPMLSLLIGVLVGVLVDVSADWRELILRGVMYGLSAVGLYETQKQVRK